MSAYQAPRRKPDHDTLETALRCARDVLATGGDGPVTIYSGWLRIVFEAAQDARSSSALREMREALAKIASECPKCRGTGRTLESFTSQYDGYVSDTWKPCLSCRDVRAAIEKATKP